MPSIFRFFSVSNHLPSRIQQSSQARFIIYFKHPVEFYHLFTTDLNSRRVSNSDNQSYLLIIKTDYYY